MELSGKNSTSTHIGLHLVCDFWGANIEKMEDEKYLRDLMINSCAIAKATVLNVSMHKFSPVGLTIIVLLSESHASIHTWPDKDYAAIDIFTCGSIMSPEIFVAELRKALKPKESTLRVIYRGSAISEH